MYNLPAIFLLFHEQLVGRWSAPNNQSIPINAKNLFCCLILKLFIYAPLVIRGLFLTWSLEGLQSANKIKTHPKKCKGAITQLQIPGVIWDITRGLQVKPQLGLPNFGPNPTSDLEFSEDCMGVNRQSSNFALTPRLHCGVPLPGFPAISRRTIDGQRTI